MYIQRQIHQEIVNHIKRKEYTIITGARQSGKTTLIRALYNELKQGQQPVSFLTFEDRDILTAINSHPEEIFSFTPRPEKNLNDAHQNNKTFYLFIDEVQYANEPSNFLKYLYDVYGENLKIIATSSSAFYIDRKFTDSLAGRKRIFELKTLSFEEWLLFKGLQEQSEELDLIKQQEKYKSTQFRQLLDSLHEYLIFGGYPEIVLEEDPEEKIRLLKELKNAYLKRDVDESGIADPDKFYILLALLADQTGNLVNRNELSNTVGTDHKTIDKYLYVLQNCFHIDLVRPFYSNLRKELTKMPKLYFKDSGFRNVALNRFFEFHLREDRGALLENCVYRRLTDLYEQDSIKYWRTADKKEIDFVVTTSHMKGTAFEVKMNSKSGKSISGRTFSESYPGFTLETISYDFNPQCRWIFKL